MSRVKKRIVKCFSALLIVLVVAGLAIPVSSADHVGVNLPVSQIFTNHTTMEVEDTFRYRLVPLEKGNPMPGQEEEEYSFSMEGTETVSLEEILFARTGIYRYRLLQTVGKEEKGYTYDGSAYTLEVHITNAAGGGLAAATLVYTEDGEKTEGISFENTYRNATGTETEPDTTAGTSSSVSPKTGDNSDLMFWLVILFASAFVFAGVQMVKKAELRKY